MVHMVQRKNLYLFFGALILGIAVPMHPAAPSSNLSDFDEDLALMEHPAVVQDIKESQDFESQALAFVQQRARNQALVLIVQQVTDQKLRLDLYEVDPNSFINRVSNFFSFDSTKIQQQHVQSVIDEIFNANNIFDLHERRSLLAQARIVLADVAVQQWAQQESSFLAVQMAKAGIRTVTWDDIRKFAKAMFKPLPNLVSGTSIVAAQSYLTGYMQMALQKAQWLVAQELAKQRELEEERERTREVKRQVTTELRKSEAQRKLEAKQRALEAQKKLKDFESGIEKQYAADIAQVRQKAIAKQVATRNRPWE